MIKGQPAATLPAAQGPAHVEFVPDRDSNPPSARGRAGATDSGLRRTARAPKRRVTRLRSGSGWRLRVWPCTLTPAAAGYGNPAYGERPRMAANVWPVTCRQAGAGPPDPLLRQASDRKVLAEQDGLSLRAAYPSGTQCHARPSRKCGARSRATALGACAIDFAKHYCHSFDLSKDAVHGCRPVGPGHAKG
jgi:hypothetical protein